MYQEPKLVVFKFLNTLIKAAIYRSLTVELPLIEGNILIRVLNIFRYTTVMLKNLKLESLLVLMSKHLRKILCYCKRFKKQIRAFIHLKHFPTLF